MAQRHDENYNEQPMTRMGRIQQPSRRYRRLRHPSFTAAIWTANNPLLQRGEFGSEIDTGKLKVGDGVTYWNDLGYVAASEIAFADITGTPDDNVALKNALDAKQDVLTEGTGIDIDSDNIISNTGVRSVATGTTNGTISVNTGGTSAEVAVYGLGSAAYTSSGDYATAAQGAEADTALQPGDDVSDLNNDAGYQTASDVATAISGKANVALDNLSSVGQNISNWSSNASNCITNIPQDIKLELNNGTLTLKAGSKVYIPNGSGTFDTVTTTADVSTTRIDSQKCMVWRYSGGNLGIFPIVLCYSGPTAPSAYQFMFWYDTTENKCKHTSDGGSTWTSSDSLPLCLVSTDGTKISAIDQVFNGFGYVGSTIFTLPGVKGLAPNGRNTDGTLNSNVINDSTVRTYTVSGTYNFALTKTANAIGAYYYAYDPVNNYIYRTDTGATYNGDRYIFGSCRVESGVIKSFATKQLFHAVDYSDTEYMAHQAMPSDRYVNLTLGASGSTYTSPADGYLTINKSATAAGQYINFINGSNGMNCNSIAPSALPLRLCMPVSKGDVITINYDAAGTTTMFRFIYANGAK